MRKLFVVIIVSLLAYGAGAVEPSASKRLKSLQAEERKLALLADEEEVEARKSYLAIESATSVNQAEEYVDSTIAHQRKSKEHKVSALRKRHEQEEIRSKLGDEDRRRQMVELEKLEVVEVEKLNALIKLAVYRGEDAKKRLDPIQARIREQKRRIDEMRMFSEDRVFDARQRTKEVELETIQPR